MFTRAGFNANHRVVCHAMIRSRNGATHFRARLIRFIPSGDLVWYSRSTGILPWDAHVRFVNAPGLPSFSTVDRPRLRAVPL